MKTMSIGGEVFEIHKATASNVPFVRSGNDFRDIYRFYTKPSRAKVEIWNDWIRWAAANNATIGIFSGNCQTFSITGEVENPETGEINPIQITARHNRIFI